MERIVNDDTVKLYWECPECGAEDWVRPYYLDEYGTPVCDKCDTDMSYNYTTIEE